jgi:4-oxalocrotonate tautomerase
MKMPFIQMIDSSGFLNMPYVNIKFTNEGVTKEQKTKLVSGVTGLLLTIFEKNPVTKVIVIDEAGADNRRIEELFKLHKDLKKTDLVHVEVAPKALPTSPAPHMMSTEPSGIRIESIGVPE